MKWTTAALGLLEAGLAPDLPETVRRRVRLGGGLAAAMLVVGVAYTAGYLWMGMPVSAWFCGFISLMYATSLVVIRSGLHRAGRLLAALSGLSSIGVFSVILGQEVGYGVLLFCGVPLAPALFSREERWARYVIVCFSIGLWVLLEDGVLHVLPPEVEDPGQIRMMRYMAGLLTFGLLAASVQLLAGERAAAQQRLEAKLDELVQEVEDRKQAEAALEVARQQAETALRMREQFLAIVSHELRTPLAGVVGMSQLLQQQPSASAQLRYLVSLQRSAETMQRLVDDLLDLSQMSAGAMTLEEASVELRPFLAGVVDEHRYSVERRGLRLRLEVGEQVPVLIQTDETRLRQVLSNLIGNARKFTTHGAIRVRVWGEGELVRFSVQDTGPGIPQAAQATLFEPFTQADGTTSRRHGGVGLGLAICRRLIEMMGGEIWVESAEGAGATFHFSVRDLGGAVLELDEDTKVVESPMLVLVVDDNETNQLVMRGLLERRGHRIMQAFDGREALGLIRKTLPDVVLMDVMMPGMDGMEATRQIRAMPPPYASLKVVALTANAFPEDRARCLAAGMDAFLSKPVHIESLSKLLIRWQGGAGDKS